MEGIYCLIIKRKFFPNNKLGRNRTFCSRKYQQYGNH